MLYLLSFLLLCWLFVLFLYRQQVIRTTAYIHTLPPILPHQPAYQSGRHPAIGESIETLLPNSVLTSFSSYKVISLSLPSCVYCKGAIEEFFVRNAETDLPLINLLVTDQQQDLDDYSDLFGPKLTSVMIDEDTLKPLMINSYPTFLLVDPMNTIIHEEGRSRKVFGIYNSLTKRGEMSDEKYT